MNNEPPRPTLLNRCWLTCEAMSSNTINMRSDMWCQMIHMNVN